MAWTDEKNRTNVTQLPSQAGESLCELIDEEAKNLCVIEQLPELIQKGDFANLQHVIPNMQLTLPHASKEFHIAASNSILSILEKNLINTNTFTQTFLQSILVSIDSKDPVVSNAWFETLMDVIELLPYDVIKNEILPIALTKGQLCHSVTDRITACKLIGKISTRLDSTQIRNDLVPIVLSLCQDVYPEVRACICCQLPLIAKSIVNENTKPSLLPSLVELASDENTQVRISAIEAIVELIPLVKSDILLHTIYPLIMKICQQSIRHVDNDLIILSYNFGKLTMGLIYNLSCNEKIWLVEIFHDISQIGLPHSRIKVENELGSNERLVKIRQNCAYNLPAMTMFSLSGGGVSLLEKTFLELALDSHEHVRRSVALSSGEVAQLLGSRFALLQPAIINLLLDDVEEVLDGVVSNLGTIMHCLTLSGAFSPKLLNQSTLDFVKALIKCETEISNTYNWRLEELLLKQLEVLPECFHSNIIYVYFIPILLSRISKSRPLPIKLAAARCLLICLRYNNNRSHRLSIRDKIITNLCHNSSFYVRSIFIRTMKIALELFSFKYFKNNFFIHLIKYADDKVPNIRLMFVELLPQLKSMMRLPADKKLLLALESSVKNLLTNEKDKDVSEKLTNIIQQLNQVEPLPENHYSSNSFSEDDKKLKEEILIEATSYEFESSDSFHQEMLSEIDFSKEITNKTSLIPSSRMRNRKSYHQRKRHYHIVPLPTEQKSPLTMADDFYVDAGIRLSGQEIGSLPSKIPNFKEIMKTKNFPDKKSLKSIDSASVSNPSNSLTSDKNYLRLNSELSRQNRAMRVHLYDLESISRIQLTPRSNQKKTELVHTDSSSHFVLDNKIHQDFHRLNSSNNGLNKKSTKGTLQDEVYSSPKKLNRNSLAPELSKDTNDFPYLNHLRFSPERKSSRRLSMIESKIATINFNQEAKNINKKELTTKSEDNRKHGSENKSKEKQESLNTREINRNQNEKKLITSEIKSCKTKENDAKTTEPNLASSSDYYDNSECDYKIVLRSPKSYIPTYKRSSVGSSTLSPTMASEIETASNSSRDSEKRLSLGSLSAIKSSESKLPIRKKK